MSKGLKSSFSRREVLGAARVALVATLAVAVSYTVVVAVLDLVVADHLTGQVDRQLAARLDVAVTNEKKALAGPGVQTIGARHGLGIYGEPIALWAFSSSGQLSLAAKGDPVLPATTRPPGKGASRSLNYGVDGATYRLSWRRTRGGWLLAGESLTELGHVEAVLVLSEAIALPFLLAVFFLVAVAIGLRSARPVELARKRQLEFTADASHELRTPLSVIEAEVSLARQVPRQAADYEGALDRVGNEAARLRRIVEDLLWLARADSEPAEALAVPVDLGEVARRSAERFLPVAASRSQHLELSPQLGEGAPLVVLSPTEWLDKLAGTLVDNASRYCGEGGAIKVSALRLEGSRRVALRVEDNGPGIAKADRGAMLLRFRRATSLPGGHGLGLAIADSVAKRTGGQLEIGTSELGGALVEASWPAGRSARLASSSPDEADLDGELDAGPL